MASTLSLLLRSKTTWVGLRKSEKGIVRKRLYSPLPVNIYHTGWKKFQALKFARFERALRLELRQRVPLLEEGDDLPGPVDDLERPA